MAVFPTAESFTRFAGNSENQAPLQSFIAFAVRNGIIDRPDEAVLAAYIAGNARGADACTPASHMSFEEFLDQKQVLLELTLSARALTDRINTLIAEHGIALPKVSNSMMTRLKKEVADTPHKQNVLRGLAFWLGHDRAHLGPHLNFETLLKLCRGAKPQAEHKEGVRIGFALYGRGDVIDHEIVGWLKKELKSYIEESIGRYSYGRWGKVRSHDITTLYVDFPKEERVSNPAFYRQCLISAVSLAHQLCIRWALSKYFTQNRFLSIGIAAGDFAVLDNYLLPVLNAKLPGDPVIRLTDYARQCVLINDIRALLCGRPAEITLFNGETLTIWWVVGLWSTLYFDFVPDLLTDKILRNDEASVAALSGMLWPPESGGAASKASAGTNAIATFFRFPHNSLLGLEIAKTLYYRRRFWEAIEILRIVLSLDPTHLNARTLRMVLFRNLALDARSYTVAEGLFKQAHQEAQFIQHSCAFQSEDFYCEFAVVHLAQAMLTLRCLRQSRGDVPGAGDVQALKQKVLAGLDQAATLFGMGMMVSPTGIRANYLLNSVLILAAVLKSDARIFIDPDLPVDAGLDVVRPPVTDYQYQLGYLRADLPEEKAYELVESMYKISTVTHDDSISLQAYRPTTYFCTAVAWWDFFPVRTVACAKRAVQLLRGAADIARTMLAKNICIYSFTRTYGEMMPAQEFIGHMERGVAMIEAQSGGDLARRDDRETIALRDTGRSGLLMTLNY
jgi:hypothetical protein